MNVYQLGGTCSRTLNAHNLKVFIQPPPPPRDQVFNCVCYFGVKTESAPFLCQWRHILYMNNQDLREQTPEIKT